MLKKSKGIHHITAIVGDPQENVDFYAGILGLRLIKKTVNFDDPETYHLYFGDDIGRPGTAMTFFNWLDGHQGKIGDGQVGITAFIVPKGSFSFWKERLEKFNIKYSLEDKFGQSHISFHDPHGLHLELVESEAGNNVRWSFGGVTPEVAIKGFFGVTLYSSDTERTIYLLENIMGLTKIEKDKETIRFSTSGEIGNIIDVCITSQGTGDIGIGTVHHIAIQVEDDQEQLEWKKHIAEFGYDVTPVRERNYFRSIYFREKGNILFEIATNGPGFMIDEAYDEMGEKLMLPQWYESKRSNLEKTLPPIKVREIEVN
ncbi:ring-cleaving dioxygenase [Alkaliphilus peptidifermentans]|uniref:Glyoxalase family protein n=1 Tax=Alkaliphilus peptidifermentans DSM 18978 TaxID=1120976 RepID=A0A1G5JJ41_9FIRM|nr:ring-cleaving dioxygenase [Alkaliphilus peptidifermentans]SCY88366.1 glyoxalase family protein [Alkaliphilus peptidifermentans DSM 18978]